jgi:hypothetical protein
MNLRPQRVGAERAGDMRGDTSVPIEYRAKWPPRLDLQ